MSGKGFANRLIEVGSTSRCRRDHQELLTYLRLDIIGIMDVHTDRREQGIELLLFRASLRET